MAYPYTTAQLEAVEAFANREIARLRAITPSDSYQAQCIHRVINWHLSVKCTAIEAQDDEAEGGFAELDAEIGESHDYNRILGALEVAA